MTAGAGAKVPGAATAARPDCDYYCGVRFEAANPKPGGNSLHCAVCDFACGERAVESRRVRCNVREFADQLFTVWRCPRCLSLHCAERVDLDRYYARYPLKRHRLTLPVQLAYANRLRRLRSCNVTREQSVLDFGCGQGLFVKVLRDGGFADAHGYDAFTPEFADPRTLARSYDVIVAQDVVEHDDDPVALFRRLSAMVAPGGLLAIGTPDAAGIDLADAETHLMALHQPYHRHIFSRQALIGLGSATGLAVEKACDRFYGDTLVPGVNTRFLMRYIAATGNLIDAAFEPIEIGSLLRSPRTCWAAFAGYFFPPSGIMTVFFRKPAGTRLP